MRPVFSRCWQAVGMVGLAIASFNLAACFVGDENAGRCASRRQIIDAAARCGLPNFKPTKAGAHWGAYVDGEDFDRGPKGNCIYADLERQGLLAFAIHPTQTFERPLHGGAPTRA